MTPLAFRPGPMHGVAALVADDGTAAAAFAQALMGSDMRAVPRDLADTVHAICALHGRNPGVIEHACCRTIDAPGWLIDGSAAFARERSYLARLTAAAGPIPSTPGQAETEAAIMGQRHAFDMLARSDREGCALGAAAALLLDWRAIRLVLDAVARRFALAPTPLALPEPAAILADLPTHRGAERAVVFGAQQLLAQHRGLWQLLEARAAARNATA